MGIFRNTSRDGLPAHPPGRLRPASRGRRRLGVTGVLRLLLLGCVLAVFVLVAVSVSSGEWQIRPVLSGSMRPGLPIGGVVVTQRVPLQSLQVRDVAVFHPPGEPRIDYIHRIISLRREGSALVIRTQGDANTSPDPWTLRVQGRWAYVARFTLPVLGYPAVWLHSPTGHRGLLLASGTLMAIVVGSLLVESRRRRRGASTPDALPDGKGTTIDGAERPAPSVADVAQEGPREGVLTSVHLE